MKEKEEVRIVFQVSPDDRTLLRLVAAKRGKDMKDLLTESIRQMAREDGFLKEGQNEQP